MLAHTDVLIHFGGEEKLESLIPLRSCLRCKNVLEISDYLKCTHLPKALILIRLHGKQHVTLDKSRIVHLGLVDVLLVLTGALLGRGANGGIKNIPHPMGSKDDPQVRNQVVKFKTSVLSLSFSRNAHKLKVGRDIYKMDLQRHLDTCS
jgi:hypothetical protein